MTFNDKSHYNVLLYQAWKNEDRNIFLSWLTWYLQEKKAVKCVILIIGTWILALSLETYKLNLALTMEGNWRRKWQPTPVLLPGESQGQRSLVGCCLWGHRGRFDWSSLAAAAATSLFQFNNKKTTEWPRHKEGTFLFSARARDQPWPSLMVTPTLSTASCPLAIARESGMVTTDSWVHRTRLQEGAWYTFWS